MAENPAGRAAPRCADPECLTPGVPITDDNAVLVYPQAGRMGRERLDRIHRRCFEAHRGEWVLT